jgi:hypothetical protein
MKIICAAPAVLRFRWEYEILLTNLQSFSVDMSEIVLLFSRHDDTIPPYLESKYGVKCFVYTDGREDKGYIPSIRPYLLWCYLSDDPAREKETYLYIDSDIIFREMIDCATLGAGENRWVGSDCGHYIDYDYIVQTKHGALIAATMAEICGITVDQMKGVPGIGAHLLITNPSADFWLRTYEDSNRIYNYFQTVDSNIQKWTAEMWAQLWGMVREGKNPTAHPELKFCTPTDPIEQWDKVKIMHNAGVIDGQELFYKGQYTDRMPFGEDFGYVRADKVSRKYVEAIEKVVLLT